jgi:hypothetical protein
VDKHAVDTHGKNFHTQFLKLGIFLGDRREFCSSNEGKVPRIKAKHYPFTEILGELEVDELALVISRSGEVRGFPSNQDHYRFLLPFLLVCTLVRRSLT